MNFQDYINIMNEAERQSRSKSQMTLGKLIEALEGFSSEKMVQGLSDPHSYRGYYCDLAFEHAEEMTAKEALEVCKSCVDQTFEGYKGGDYVMGVDTPVWFADWGSCGLKITKLREDGKFVLRKDEY